MEENKYPTLYDADIINNKFMYDIETIEWNIRHSFLSLRILVRNQKLTPYVCAKYVAFGGRNEKYADCREDAWLATGDILYHQRHITKEEMDEAHAIADEEDMQEDMQDDECKNMRKEDIRLA
jgi:hypothetical protein